MILLFATESSTTSQQCKYRLLAQIGPVGHVCSVVAMRESGHSVGGAPSPFYEYTASIEPHRSSWPDLFHGCPRLCFFTSSQTWIPRHRRANGSGPKWPADDKLRDAVLGTAMPGQDDAAHVIALYLPSGRARRSSRAATSSMRVSASAIGASSGLRTTRPP